MSDEPMESRQAEPTPANAEEEAPKPVKSRSKKGEELPLPHLGKTALVALGIIVLLGWRADKLALGLLSGLPLFLGLGFFRRSKSSRSWASGLRICGFLFSCTGIGIVMDTLVRPVGFVAFGLFIGLLFSWLFETGASTDFT